MIAEYKMVFNLTLIRFYILDGKSSIEINNQASECVDAWYCI